MWSAFALLTIVPGSRDAAPPDAGSVPWFPFVGLCIGGLTSALLVALAGAVAKWGSAGFFGHAAVPLAVLVTLAWAAVTRMLHYDGAADVADALWGGATPGRRLEIMNDSATGAFGATAVALLVIGQVAGIATVLAASARDGSMTWLWLLAAVPALGRASAMFGAWFGSPARPGGLGARVIASPRLGAIALGIFWLAAAAAVMYFAGGLAAGALLAAGILIALAVPHIVASKLGGVTGDVLGAGVVVTEVSVSLLMALWVSW